MGIIEIAAIILFIGFIISAFNAEKDWATWTAIGSIAGLWLCFVIGFIPEPKQPKTIETTHPSKIDTIITIKNLVSDTTYVYTFIPNEKTMTKAEEAALNAYPNESFIDESYADMARSFYEEGYEQAQQDIIAIIQSRIDKILGDAQPNPILRMELQELIKKIEA